MSTAYLLMVAVIDRVSPALPFAGSEFGVGSCRCGSALRAVFQRNRRRK